jgi:AraC-like DNA-binding protein
VLGRLASELHMSPRHAQSKLSTLEQALSTYYNTVRTRVNRYAKTHESDWKKVGQLARFGGRRDRVSPQQHEHEQLQP